MNPILFNLAINCKDESVFFRGRDKPPFRAVVFPFPYDPNPFSSSCSEACPRDPQNLVLAKGFCSLGQKVFARSSGTSPYARSETPEYSKMVAGFLGAEAPKRREKDRLGRGEGKEKLLRTVVPFLPHKSTYNLAIYRKVKPCRPLWTSLLKIRNV